MPNSNSSFPRPQTPIAAVDRRSVATTNNVIRRVLLVLVVAMTGLSLASVVGPGASQTSAAQLGGLLGHRVRVPVVTVVKVRKMQLEFAKRLAKTPLLDRPNTKKPEPEFVLIDVRDPAESDVSVIPGAITAKDYESDPSKYEGRQIIAYCTSGYRSDKYAAKLIERDVNAVNMKASILGWCAAKLPLETKERKPTRRVHTYSSQNKVPGIYEAIH